MEPNSGMASLLQSPLPMLVMMFAIWYFLLIRPQQKRQKELQNAINKMEKNDEVVTSGGIHATVVSVHDKTATVRIAENVRVELEKSAILEVKKGRSA